MATKSTRSSGSQPNKKGIAQGVTLVHPKSGEPINEANPLAVQLSDGSIDIGTVNAELEVQLSHANDVPDAGDVADSVQIGDGTDIMQVEADGSARVEDDELQKLAAGVQPIKHDEIDISYRNSAPGDGEIDTVVFKNASSIVATLTLTYDGSDRLSNIIRS